MDESDSAILRHDPIMDAQAKTQSPARGSQETKDRSGTVEDARPSNLGRDAARPPAQAGRTTDPKAGNRPRPAPARRVQTDARDVERILRRILDSPVPPVARCRLLSSGFAATHMLNVSAPIAGSKACLGCGNCIDACGLLSREPKRLDRTAQRSSLALETMVGTDCDRCDNCVLACPQVDTTIKHHVVSTRMVEQMERLLDLASADETDWFDWHAEAAYCAEGETRRPGATPGKGNG